MSKKSKKKRKSNAAKKPKTVQPKVSSGETAAEETAVPAAPEEASKDSEQPVIPEAAAEVPAVSEETGIADEGTAVPEEASVPEASETAAEEAAASERPEEAFEASAGAEEEPDEGPPAAEGTAEAPEEPAVPERTDTSAEETEAPVEETAVIDRAEEASDEPAAPEAADENAVSEETAEEPAASAEGEQSAETPEVPAGSEETVAETIETVEESTAVEGPAADAGEPAAQTKAGNAIRIAVAVLAVIVSGILLFWPRFHDLTVELGVEAIPITEFMNWIADPAKALFVSDPALVDISKVGSTRITVRTGRKKQEVLLHVVDTTAPAVVFKESVVAPPGTLPAAGDFIEEIVDRDEITVTFAEDPVLPGIHGESEIPLLVTDASGNVTRGVSRLSAYWMKPEVTVEYGTELTKQDLLTGPTDDADLISQEDIDRINEADLGTYEISIRSRNETETCRVTVQDTTPPALELHDVLLYFTQEAEMEDFVIGCSDAYGEVELKLETELDFSEIGVQQVRITATDRNGNHVTGEAELTIKEDDVGPEFYGLTALNVGKYQGAPNYYYGVEAIDNIDGWVEFTCSDAGVDYDKAGVYYVTYTARDSKGNVGTAKRTVAVGHDTMDEEALCEAFFANITDRSPEGIGIYVREHIVYTTSWGEEDPVWYGIKNLRGNCYVHAAVLGEMLNRAGYPNHLIWSYDEGHYWNQVFYDGVWWHIDSTPSRYFPTRLMDDEDRDEHLVDYDWDRNQFSPCPGLGGGERSDRP